ncbi:MAG: hypothetical protein KGO81_14995 [Bacteroidota bacterium]|nr:hypothetical protein [Bacteroidota bacterium]
MEADFREKQRKSYTLMRMIYDLTMALLFIGMAVVMFGGEAWKIERIVELGRTFSWFFGSICLLYGGFRLYRGLKKDY